MFAARHDVRKFFLTLFTDFGKNALPKCDQVQALNPNGRCHYCNMPLTGGASTQADHIEGNGAENRQKMTGRQEIAKNVAGEMQTLVFACAVCNAEKGNMTADEYMNTEVCKALRAYHAER